MKKAAFALAALALSAPALATDVSSNFNVRVTLTSACKVNTAAGNIDLAYTAFQTTEAKNSANASFDCTRGFTPTSVKFDDNGTDKVSGAAAASASGSGVVAGLQYTLTAAHDATASTPGTDATAASTGSADVRAYKIEVTIPASQAGTHQTTGQQTHARTLILTY